MAMKVVVNPTWRCQLHCIYCWMHGLGFKPGQECSPRQWLWFLAQLPGPTTVDFSGGEPLLYEGIIDLIQRLAVRDIGWAMTSNLMNAHKVARILNGDPTYPDSWTDIGGYAKLVEQELNGELV